MLFPAMQHRRNAHPPGLVVFPETKLQLYRNQPCTLFTETIAEINEREAAAKEQFPSNPLWKLFLKERNINRWIIKKVQ